MSLDEINPTVDGPAELDATEAVDATPGFSEPSAESAAALPTIGVFDSGVGGFTVAGAILQRRPDLNLVYYADSINLPYGGRSQQQLERFSNNIVEFLREHGATLLADGCNTINRSLAGPTRTIEYHMPVFDLVDSTIDWLKTQRPPRRIALLATVATITAGFWEKRLGDSFLDAEVFPIAAPDLVPLIEAGNPDLAAIRRAVNHYTGLFREAEVDTVIFGCTHYPLLKDQFVESDVLLRYVDPAQCLADKLVASLQPAAPDAPKGKLRFYNSLPSEHFYRFAERIFGRSIRDLTSMYIVNPYED